MARKQEDESFMEKIWKMGLRPFLESLVDAVENRIQEFQRRFLNLILAYLFIFSGLFFLILGVFFLLVDYAGIPRGVVFTAGGLAILFISFLFLRLSQKK